MRGSVAASPAAPYMRFLHPGTAISPLQRVLRWRSPVGPRARDPFSSSGRVSWTAKSVISTDRDSWNSALIRHVSSWSRRGMPKAL